MFGKLSRRDFLKFIPTVGFALTVPTLPRSFHSWVGARKAGFLTGLADTGQWPEIHAEDYPSLIRTVLSLTPNAWINKEGFLEVLDENDRPMGRVLMAQTQWNKDHMLPGDRLDPRVPWGIVLHWYGDTNEYSSIASYLNGFNAERLNGDYVTRTSSHFLVGDDITRVDIGRDTGYPFGILQMQYPDKDGTPFVSSHLRSELDQEAHARGEQYFVQAFYRLERKIPGLHGLLEDMFDGYGVDPNMRTFSIELTGTDFDNQKKYLSEQKIANALAVVWAIMKRYGIPSTSILGHQEIQVNKSDPGKKFMALMRTLVGAKALADGDNRMKQLVFGQFLNSGKSASQAIASYFQFAHDYLLEVSFPKYVFEWEGETNYWSFSDQVTGRKWTSGFASQRVEPLQDPFFFNGDLFMLPWNHEGIDFHYASSHSPDHVSLIAGGECLFLGTKAGFHRAKTAIFKHRRPDGAEVLSIYSNLGSLGDIRVNGFYPVDYPVGKLAIEADKTFLHYAMAYGATWETDLSVRQYLPGNASADWITSRFLSPANYLDPQLISRHVNEFHRKMDTSR